MIDKYFLFLIGAGRSGTTLLYKLLSLHPDVGFTSNYDDRLPRWLPSGLLVRGLSGLPNLKRATWFEHGGVAYTGPRHWLKKLVPMPAEAESVYSRCGFPLYPTADYQMPEAVRCCLQKTFCRMRNIAGSKVFVSKRTANNRRIPWLNEAFPEARFVNLLRDGRDVAYSLSRVEWWRNDIVFWAGRTAAELESEGLHPLAICARTWVEEVRAIQQGLGAVPREHIHNVQYETFLQNPLVEMKRILDFLGLECSQRFLDQIESFKLSRREPAWTNVWTEDDLQQVLTEQGSLLEELGYLSSTP